jgi:hypothetical protein
VRSPRTSDFPGHSPVTPRPGPALPVVKVLMILAAAAERERGEAERPASTTSLPESELHGNA